MHTSEHCHVWVTEMLPCLIHDIAVVLHQQSVKQGTILHDSNMLWDELCVAWFQQSSNQLPTTKFCLILARYTVFLTKLAIQGQRQKELLMYV